MVSSNDHTLDILQRTIWAGHSLVLCNAQYIAYTIPGLEASVDLLGRLRRRHRHFRQYALDDAGLLELDHHR
jgi:hypothetical protein